MKRFSLGDKVRVIDWGKSYSIYTTWVKKFAPWALEKFEASKEHDLANGMVGVVIAYGEHERYKTMLYLVNIEGFGYALIEEDAIEQEGHLATPSTELLYGIKMVTGEVINVKLNLMDLERITSTIKGKEVLTINDARGELWVINTEHIVYLRRVK